MDGTEVARRMRQLESDGLQSVLLAVTAYCTAEDRELCLKSGMDAFVGKPLTPEKLRKVLVAAGRRLLASASVQAQPETPAVEIDTSLLAYLSDGSPEGLRTQCNKFISTLDQFEAEVNAAVGENDPERVRVAAHRLLGQAKIVGAGTLGEIALAMETAATANDLAACRNLLPRTHAEIITLTEAMSRPRPAARSA
jgi:CheY-like chemotaxis protein